MARISALGIIIVALVLMYLLGNFAFGSVGLIGSLIINSIVGFVLLYLANMIGIRIPINIVTILVVAIFGLLGLVLLVLLEVLGAYSSDSRPKI
ncbi:MAG: pro-sigmaK processing inhibitor BofA family protein [Candidatus Micrarchaeia archaeon]|jgi:pro-sigmaK processing inhibitor BofA